jgi:hypothetical protein
VTHALGWLLLAVVVVLTSCADSHRPAPAGEPPPTSEGDAVFLDYTFRVQ